MDARFATTLDNGGAAQAMGVILAILAIEAGMANTVICACGIDAWSQTHRTEEARGSERDQGAPARRRIRPGIWLRPVRLPRMPSALSVTWISTVRRASISPKSPSAFANMRCAIRPHRCASRSPREDYFNARMIASPFGVFDCSLRSDGAAAVIVTSLDRARDLKQRPILVKGFGSHNNLTGWFARDNMVQTAAGPSGGSAYRMAGVGPGDIDLAQIYDCFTYMVLVQLEDYGFCAKGEGGPFVASGALALDGRLPCNTSGGMLSEAHIEGMLQICEAVRQLRRAYSAERQVPNAEIALVSGHGGNQVCHATLILGRS